MCTFRILKSLTFAALLASLTACGTYSSASVESAPDTAITATHKSPDQILVTQSDITDRKYATLGDVSVTVRKWTIFDKDPTPAQVDQALKERAAEMGADAVVLTRYGTVGIGFSSWGVLDGNGRAVVFQ